MESTQKLKQEIKQAAEEYLAKGEVVTLPFSGYEDYLTSGNRLLYERAYFERRRQLAVMALAVYTGNRSEESLCFLEQIIWEVCNEYTWALPAHLTLSKDLFDESAPFCIDLFAAETGQTLAEIIELIGSTLSPVVVQRVQTEIERRIFQPFEAHEWAWEKKENNWSAVIAGCIGMTALSSLPPESSRLQRIIERLDISMASYLRGFGEDGACVEGVGYWSYGFGYFIYYAERLAEVLNDSRYLQLPKVKAIASFPYFTMSNERQYVPFSDYSRPAIPSGLVSFCKDYFNILTPMIQEASPLDFDHCYRFAPLFRNLIWTKPSDSTEQRLAVNHYFADAQWLLIKDTNPDFFFAAKGGSNEESHNHIDIGHFVLGNEKTLFLTDLGAGEYTRDYFVEEKRYNYFPTAAASHHLPVINGKEQQPGAVAAREVFAEMNTGNSEFFLDLQETYSDNAELKHFKRSFQIDGCQRTLILKDHFDFETEMNHVVENFVTAIPPVISGTEVLLEAGGQCCRLELVTETISVFEKVYKDHEGNEQTVYQIQSSYDIGQNADLVLTFRLEEK